MSSKINVNTIVNTNIPNMNIPIDNNSLKIPKEQVAFSLKHQSYYQKPKTMFQIGSYEHLLHTLGSKLSSCSSSSFNVSPVDSGQSTPLQFHMELDQLELEQLELVQMELVKLEQSTGTSTGTGSQN